MRKRITVQSSSSMMSMSSMSLITWITDSRESGMRLLKANQIMAKQASTSTAATTMCRNMSSLIIQLTISFGGDECLVSFCLSMVIVLYPFQYSWERFISRPEAQEISKRRPSRTDAAGEGEAGGGGGLKGKGCPTGLVKKIETSPFIAHISPYFPGG